MEKARRNVQGLHERGEQLNELRTRVEQIEATAGGSFTHNTKALRMKQLGGKATGPGDPEWDRQHYDQSWFDVCCCCFEFGNDEDEDDDEEKSRPARRAPTTDQYLRMPPTPVSGTTPRSDDKSAKQ